MRTIFIVGFGLVVGLLGCDKGAGGAGGGGGGGGKTSLTQAQIDEVANKADPDKVDKALADATSKLGAPAKVEGDTSIWYGLTKDGKGCYRLKISKTKGIESGTTDNASCGLK